MTITYNPFLVAKMLDRAGHSGTPDGEALVAVRKANDHCSSRGKTIGDVVRFVDGDIYADAADMRHADLLREIAELTLARDDAEARAATQAETIANLRLARDEDALTIHGLRAEIVALGEKPESQDVPVPSIEPVPTMVGEAPVVQGLVIEMPEAAVSESGGVHKDQPSEPSRIEPVDVSAQCDASLPHEAEAATRFSWAEYARFNQLTTLGRARSSIARTLSREFGGRFSVSRVAEMLRQRWLSPAYLRSLGGFGLTG